MAESSPIEQRQRERIVLVDAIRGFALMGLFLVHMLESFGLYWANPAFGLATSLVFALLKGKCFTLLAICFGFSAFTLVDKASGSRAEVYLSFLWRMLILEFIGFLHALLYRGDIIQLLALVGSLLILACAIRSCLLLLGIAVLLAFQPHLWVGLLAAQQGAGWANRPPHFVWDPAMSVFLHGDFLSVLRINLWAGQISKWWFLIESGRANEMAALFLLGIVLARARFFPRLEQLKRARRIALLASLAAVLILYVSRKLVTVFMGDAAIGEGGERYLVTILGSWTRLAGTFVWLLLICAAWQGGARALVRPLAWPGRVTLTLYVTQSLVFVPIFYAFGLGLHDGWNPPVRLAVGLGGIVVQVAMAQLWFRSFHCGPIEWLWRALTYKRWDIPFRRSAAARRARRSVGAELRSNSR